MPAAQETGPTHVQPSPQAVNHQETTSQSNGSAHAVNVPQQPSQQQQQQTGKVAGSTQPSSTEGQRPEGVASYAGIAKLNSATNSTSNSTNAGVSSGLAPRPAAPNTAMSAGSVPPSSSGPTAPNNVRPPMKPGTGRVSNNPAGGPPSFNQGRGGGGGNNYYQQNNRGNYWNETFEQDHSPARRSGLTVSTAPNENQVFVGSLPAEFTPQTLTECFTKFGRVFDSKIYQTNNENKKVRTIVFLRPLMLIVASRRIMVSSFSTILKRHHGWWRWNTSFTMTTFD